MSGDNCRAPSGGELRCAMSFAAALFVLVLGEFFPPARVTTSPNPSPRHKACVADEMVHALGVLVEFLVQLVLFGEQSIELAGEVFTLLRVGLGESVLLLLRRLAQLFLILDHLLQIVHE